MTESRPLSFSMKDDARVILRFLEWYNTYTLGGTDEEITKQFIAERGVSRAVSIPSTWDDSPQPESVTTSTHGEGDPILYVKPLKTA